MFNTDKITATVNHSFQQICEALLRLQALTDDFNTPFNELSQPWQLVATYNAADVSVHFAILHTLGFGMAYKQAVNNLHPKAAKYLSDLAGEVQAPCIDDPVLHERLTNRLTEAQSWHDYNSKLDKLDHAAKQPSKKSDAPAHPSAPDQGQAAA